MSQRICSIEGCKRPVHVKSRGWCNAHYLRWRKRGSTDNPCPSCGATFDGNAKYCSDECRPRCAVDGCGSPRVDRDWCQLHAGRWRRNGDPEVLVRRKGRVCDVPGCGAPHEAQGLCGTHYGRVASGKPLLRLCVTCGVDFTTSAQRSYCSEKCRPVCEVVGCGRPLKTRGRCVRCYSDLLAFERTGQPRAYRWATEKRCVICGATEWEGKGRKVCSGRCQQLLARNGGEPPPTLTECARCGSVIDLTERGKAGRKKRADTKMCHWCKERRHMRHKVSVMDVVNQRGIEPCAICSEPVDLALRHPDLFRASIDHITPYSRGGTHDLDNLQVVHLYCNFLKSDREGFTL